MFISSVSLLVFLFIYSITERSVIQFLWHNCRFMQFSFYCYHYFTSYSLRLYYSLGAYLFSVKLFIIMKCPLLFLLMLLTPSLLYLTLVKSHKLSFGLCYCFISSIFLMIFPHISNFHWFSFFPSSRSFHLESFSVSQCIFFTVGILWEYFSSFLFL